MNKDIRKLHKRLGRTVAKLSQRLGKSKTPEEAQAILREMQEVNFRVTVAGSLLFASTTASMNESIEGILEAADAVDEEIQAIEKLGNLIKAVGKYLGQVDKLLDAAKLML